jgi:hypothetical protein
MHTIDLGEEVKFKVVYKGQEFTLREPTVGEIEKMKSAENMDSADFIAGFLNQLGFDGELVKGMGVSKAKILIDGLTDLVTKKK